MSKEKQFIEWLGRVTEFCLSRAGKCFGGWTPEEVFMYLGKNAARGELFVVGDGDVEAVGIANRTTKGLFIKQVIGTRKECRVMFQQAMLKWPEVRRFFTYRRGQLREVSFDTMRRMSA